MLTEPRHYANRARTPDRAFIQPHSQTRTDNPDNLPHDRDRCCECDYPLHRAALRECHCGRAVCFQCMKKHRKKCREVLAETSRCYRCGFGDGVLRLTLCKCGQVFHEGGCLVEHKDRECCGDPNVIRDYDYSDDAHAKARPKETS